jgi:YHS domain-containing protein
MIRKFLLLLAAAWFALAHAGAAEPVSSQWLTGAAIGGKDVVSYYAESNKTAHQVADGNKAFAVQHLGHAWWFASKASADKFAANPQAYVPQYNGHCANALASDEGLINTSGAVWEFFGDKLYLFYAERGRQRWLDGNWKVYKQKADAAWQAILAKQDK